MFAPRAVDLNNGFCVGSVLFIIKMLYSRPLLDAKGRLIKADGRNTDGGIMYAREFNLLYNRTIHSSDLYKILHSYYIIYGERAYGDSIGHSLPVRQLVTQLNAEFEKSLLSLIEKMPNKSPYEILQSDLFKSSVFGSIFNIPPSFWFYNVHLSQILTDPRAVFFPFIAEIMNTQNRLISEYLEYDPDGRQYQFLDVLYRYALSTVRDPIFLTKTIGKIYSTQVSHFLNKVLNDKIKLLSHRNREHQCHGTPDVLYKINYILGTAALRGYEGHIVCGWEVEEYVPENIRVRKTRTFFFDPNFGLFELDEEEELGTTITNYWKQKYLHNGEANLVCTFLHE